MKSHVELNLGGGEEALTPLFEALAGEDELTMKNVVWVQQIH
jgi:hypothetical protein